ncbi:ATP-binding protein [Chromobacterium sphagni]|uniref:histidine kinase n=1 Tax=Chromobacterium sphagni TaxID=1903179 RepID=A0ABX3CC80_9NEIS|nr:ATP-binding protein [Chromobacterium sphagni]OHX19635.1 two-component sensor histidine kinase [Chromobacterium sphagni]
MDSIQKQLRESVQFRLSLSLATLILLLALAAGAFSFTAAYNEANALQDDVLRQVAALFNQQHIPLAHQANRRLENCNEESRVVIQYLSDSGKAKADSDAGTLLPLPTSLPDGLHTLQINGESFRVLLKTTVGKERIAVAQETGLRDQIARDSALRTVMPFLVLVPMLLLAVSRLVRKIFQPIAVLSGEIDRRGELELHPVETAELPAEIRPFVVAINRLLERVAQMVENQRRFVADAAHELRSPLTALSLQAERMAQTDMPLPAWQRLEALRRGIERGRVLLDQLLALARVQAAPKLAHAPVSAQQVYRQVLEDLLPLAEAKRIDIGVEGEQDAQIAPSELDLLAMVKNLVDNAIRYTPHGGRVDLEVVLSGGGAMLRIVDSGPGIPPEERDRVFDPFYRALGTDQLGSSLGLSIIKAIADRIGADVRLDWADPAACAGLCVCVAFPPAALAA